MISNLASYLDLANHHPNATPDQINSLCQNVTQYKFNAAFVNPIYVSLAKSLVGPADKVGTVISFPLGQDTLEVKLTAINNALELGADELDVSANVALFKQAHWDQALENMKRLVAAVKDFNPTKIIKFIIETGYLTPEEITQASLTVLNSGADFVKTCSGMGPRGVTLEDVKLIKQVIGDQIKIKVAGGVTNYDQAIQLITAGASRIGTSKAVDILTAAPQTEISNFKS